MSRLSVRLFVSYVAVVLASTGVAFVTARSLAPTLFRVGLEQERGAAASSGSTIGRPATAGTAAPGTATTTGADRTPTPATSGPSSPPNPPTSGARAPQSGPTTTHQQNGSSPSPGNGEHDGGSNGSAGGEDLGSMSGIFAAGTVPTTIIEVEVGVNEAFLDAIDGALLAGLAAALLVSLATAGLVSRRIMRPISQVRAATVRLAEGRYTERVPTPREQELADLAGDVNRLAEALEATETRRQRLISEVAHELRTPLTTIQGSMEGLMDGVLEPSDRVFSSVADEAGRLQRVVSDLGLLSRLDESALPLAITMVDVGHVASQVAARLRPQFDDQGVRLVESGLGCLEAEADPDRLAQVFTNLLGNALGHTHEHGVVYVSGHERDEFVEVTIADDGDGIEHEELERIFDRFHRGAASRRQGSGLGLTIARSIARAHGGDITVASPGPGAGSSFTVVVPRRMAAGSRTVDDSTSTMSAASGR